MMHGLRARRLLWLSHPLGTLGKDPLTGPASSPLLTVRVEDDTAIHPSAQTGEPFSASPASFALTSGCL